MDNFYNLYVRTRGGENTQHYAGVFESEEQAIRYAIGVYDACIDKDESTLVRLFCAEKEIARFSGPCMFGTSNA